MFTEDEPTFHGDHFQIENALNEPKTRQRSPPAHRHRRRRLRACSG